MIGMFKSLGVVAALACVTVSQASALTIPGVENTTGAVFAITAPASVKGGALEDNNKLFFFKERQEHVLTGNVTVDIVNPGTYNINTVTPTVINAGRKLDSYFLHFDPVGASQTVQQVKGSIKFETEVIGIIITQSRLDASDPLLKATSTLYPTGTDVWRGLDYGPYTDLITLGADRKTVDINIFYATTGLDQVRILTNPIPEPAFFQMGALAAMSGLGLLRLRRKS